MRRDIKIHINTSDLVLTASNKLQLRMLNWVECGISRQYLYGEFEIPIHVSVKSIFENGIMARVGYTPVYLPMQIRIKRVADDGSFEYLVNPANNSDWFKVTSNLYGTTGKREIKASELTLIDDSALWFRFEEELLPNNNVRYTGQLQVFSAHHSDFTINNANHQNSNLLLKCLPTNCYRYPLSGVGLVRWMNGDFVQSEAAEYIKNEFADDGVVIRTAVYDEDSEQLLIDANFDD